jgi:hypothetical protein
MKIYVKFRSLGLISLEVETSTTKATPIIIFQFPKTIVLSKNGD